MSFGLAFAQGLIGGFRKNIAREEEARATDDERYAELQKLLFDATVKAEKDGDPVPKTMGNKLQEAKTAMDKSRKDNPIGLFGTGVADRLNVDMTDLSTIFSDVAKAGSYLAFGNSKFQIPLIQGSTAYHEKDVQKSEFQRGRMFNDSIFGFLSDKAKMSKFITAARLDPSILKDFSRQYKAHKKDYKTGYLTDQSGKGVLKDQLRALNFKGRYDKGMVNLLDRITNSPEGSTIEAVRKANQLILDRTGSKVKKNTLYYLADKLDTEEMTPKEIKQGHKDLRVMSFQVTDANYKAAKKIAEFFFKDKNARASDWLFYTQKHMYGGIFKSRAMDIFKKSETKIRQVLESSFHSMKLVQNGFLGTQFGGEPKRISAIEKLYKEVNGDRLKIAMAVAPLITIPNDAKNAIDSSGGNSLILGYSKREEMDKKYGIKYKDFKEAYDAGISANSKIDKIIALENRTGLGDNWARSVYTAFGGAFNEGGAISSIGGIISGKYTMKEGDTEADFMATVQNAFENGIISSSTNFSAIDALKLSVAADMARAIDPNGRLSNQDFSIQLSRLGGGAFSSKEQTMAKLMLVRDEFRDKLDRLKVIDTMFTTNDSGYEGIGMSPNEHRIMLADLQSTSLINQIGDNVKRQTILKGGENIKWFESAQHPGYFRIIINSKTGELSNDYYSSKNQESKLSREDRNKLIIGSLKPNKKIDKKDKGDPEIKEVEPIDSLNNPDTSGEWVFKGGNNKSAQFNHPTLGIIFVTRKGDKWVLQEGAGQ